MRTPIDADTDTDPDRPAAAETEAGADDEDVLAPWGTYSEQVRTARLGTMLGAIPRFARLLLGLAWQASPVATVATCVLQLAVAAVSAFGLLAAAGALNSLLARPSTAVLRAALPTIGLVVGIYALRGLAEAGAAAANARLKPSVRRVAEERVLVAAAEVDLVAYDDPEFHDLMMRARDRSAPYIDQGANQMIEFGGSMISLMAMSGTLAALNPVLLPVMALSVLPQAWAAVHGARLGYAVMLRTHTANRRLWLTSDLLADRACAAELRAFTAQPFLLAKYRRLAAALERTQVRLGYAQARFQVVGRTLSGIGVAGAYALLTWLVATGATPVGAAGAAVIAIQAGRAALTRSADALNHMYEQSLYVGDYARFLADAAERIRPSAEASAPARPNVIAVRDVTFSYPGQAEPALRGITLTLRRGEVLALVGENGSGKTTLALLLAGLHTPDTGIISWDGVDLAGADPGTVHEHVALVMQNPVRWPLTVLQNITIGRPERADPHGAAFATAVRTSSADEIAAGLPDGWATLLSKQFKGGHDLSGGQWQRIAVARALYRDAPVLICDEPTAALDAQAEAAVYDSLRRLARGRAVVFITHRLGSTRDADRIAVLHRGRLAEYGAHEELMAAGGRYAAMYALQAHAYQPSIASSP